MNSYFSQMRKFLIFDYLYDKVVLYDLLKDVVRGDMPASAITRQWQELEGIQQYMLNFLENHDEQRFASDFFAGDAKKAPQRAHGGSKR